MKRFLSFVIAMVMILSLFPAMIFTSSAEDAGSNIEEPAQSEYYFDLKADPVKIPTVAEGLNGVTLWEGDVDFGASGAGIVTFVIKATGINTPVSLSRFLPTYTMQNNIDYWAVNNTWGGGNTGLDGEGTECSLALNIPRDGTYVISIGRKVFGMAGAGNVLTISKLRVADINDAYKATYPLVNDNGNAQISLLSISKGNPKFTAYFYDEYGNKIGEATKEYPKAQEANDSQTTKKTTCLTPNDMFALTGKDAPAKESENGYKYVLSWVDSEGNPVDAVYKNMNLFASFVPVAADQAEVIFVDPADRVISSSYVDNGSTVEFTGATPSIDTNATTEYMFVGWATEKGGEAVDLPNYTITEDTTFYPVFTEKTLPVVTLFENPVSTTFGTKKNLLPDGFTATVSGLTGYTVLLKIDGIPYGETAKWGGIRPVVTAVNGSTYDPLSPVWCGNWANDTYRANSYTFSENGYYLYYIPFKNITNDYLNSEKTVAGVSRLNSLTVFDKTGSLGWYGAADTTTDENITVTLVGMVEGNITPFDVDAKYGDDVLATKKTTASINMLNSVNNAGWAKLDTAFDLFGGQLGSTDTSYIKHWTNDAGDINEYILTEKVVRPVYGESVLVTLTAADETAYGIKEYAVDVTLGAETVDYAEIVLEYNKDVFTNPRLEDGTVLEECPEGAILNITGANTAKVLFDISQNAVGGTYSINADGTCDSAPAKTTGAVSIKVNGQQPGGYFTEGENRMPLYKTNENNAPVDEEGNEVDEQKVWTGNVDFGGQKNVATFVFKVDGVQTDINATRIHFNTNNGGQWRTEEWSQWRTNWGRDADKTNGFASALTFKASDGATYYYLSLGNRYINNDSNLMYSSMEGFTLFKKDPSSKTTKLSWVDGDYSETQAAFNENENAGFEMLAVVGGNLAPTVEFYNDTAKNGGELIEKPVTHEYPKAQGGWVDGTGANTKMKKYGTLATVAEVFAASRYQTPVKASTETEAYEFIGWVDEDGNDITNAPVYKAQRIYANFKTIEATTSTVTFMNDGEKVAEQKILLNAYATAPESTPTRAGIPTGEYTFKGWSLETDGEVIELDTYPITEDLTLYASYEYQDVTFTVIYKDEDGEEVGTETVVRSTAVTQAPTMKRKFDSYSYSDDDWHNLEKQIENNLGKQYYDFVEWTNEDGSAVDLTNVWSDLTVYAKYEAKPIENWYKVEWRIQKGVNETRITAQWIAEGDSTYTLPGWAYGWQPLHNTADENYWYTRNGWDQDTTCVTENMLVYPHYDTTPVVTGKMPYKTNVVDGEIGQKHVLWNANTTLDQPYDGLTVVIRVTGASAENPVMIGDVFAELDGNNSNNAFFMIQQCQDVGLMANITDEEWHFISFGANVITGGNPGKNKIIKYLALDDPSDSRCPSSTGTGSYEAYMFMGSYQPTVRFYSEDSKWLETRKYTINYNASNVVRGTLVTPDDLFMGELPEDFLYWADKNGNKVTEITDNMDLYAVCKHVHTYENAVATGAGVISCTDPKCDDIEGSIISAATVTAGDATVKAPKVGETFTVPVVITNNPGVIGITLAVETSANVSLTGASVDGTLYEGAYMTYVNDIVLNRGDNVEGNLTEDGTVVYLTLTALETMNEGDKFTIKVSVTDTAADSDTGLYAPVLYSDYTNEYTVIARDPEIKFDTLSFTVGNTMSFNVNVKFTPNSAYYDTNEAKLTVEMQDENDAYVVLGEESVTAEKDENGTYDMTFTVDGIPMAYLANNLKVRFTTVGAEGVLEAEEDQMMDSEGEYVDISFENYSEYLKAEGGNEKLTTLLDTMLNYTAAVQQYKGYKENDLANKNVENKEIKSIKEYDEKEDWGKYTAMRRGVTSTAAATVRFTGSKLLMTSDKTGFRFVFTVEEGVEVESLKLLVKCDDEIVAEISGSDFEVQEDGKYHADFDGYAPNEFDTQIKVIVVDANGDRISNMAYDSIPGVAKAVANNDRYESLCPVLSGMLAYCDAVKGYMASVKN